MSATRGELIERLREEARNSDHFSDNRPLLASRLLAEAAQALIQSEQERDEALAECFTIDPENGVAVAWEEVAATHRSEASAWKARATQSEQRLEEARRVIEPFARFGELVGAENGWATGDRLGLHSDDLVLLETYRIGDFRAALAFLTSLGEQS